MGNVPFLGYQEHLVHAEVETTLEPVPWQRTGWGETDNQPTPLRSRMYPCIFLAYSRVSS